MCDVKLEVYTVHLQGNPDMTFYEAARLICKKDEHAHAIL